MASSVAADALDVIARVPSLAGSPRVVTELPGGLTNRNYKVTTPDGAPFVYGKASEGFRNGWFVARGL